MRDVNLVAHPFVPFKKNYSFLTRRSCYNLLEHIDGPTLLVLSVKSSSKILLVLRII